MQPKRLIDVSKHNGSIDFEKVKYSGIEGVIIRAGYGREVSQKDVKFEEHYSRAKAAGLPVGAYWYSYCLSPEEAIIEANACIEAIKGKTFEYPIYFDIEERKQFDLGQKVCSEICKAFCNTLEKSGYFTGIYSSKSHLENYISKEVRNRYAIFVAHYGIAKTTYNGQYGMWQYSSEGRIAGIGGNVDLDLCYCDYPTIIKNKGLNGFKAASSQPEAKPPKEEPKKESYTSYTVKKGDTLWDIAEKYLGNGSRYKEIMKASGITSETIYPKQILKIPAK